MIFDAISFATESHKGQFRKGTKIPYIVHPINVGKILIENNCPDEVVEAGILHDTVEDTNVTIEDIQRKFGDQVAEIVSGCSEPDKSDTWENRKKHTIEYLELAPIGVLLASCADKLDNFRSIKADYNKYGDTIWSRFNRPKEQQTWYYESLAEIFHKQADKFPEWPLFSEFYNEVLKNPDSPFVKHNK